MLVGACAMLIQGMRVGGIPLPFGIGFLCILGPLASLLLFFTGGNFLMVFTPRATLSIDSDAIRHGDTLKIKWRIRGAAHKVQDLKIFLTGFQKDERAFKVSKDMVERILDLRRTVEIFESSSPVEIRSGSFSWTVPESVPVSTGLAPMAWTLRLQGSIAGWPDVYEEIDVDVFDA
ncbi:hypothetical protein [Rubripirellula tenax]|uniref:hypothetical protein n=1 Tax=Rubripirellula tenax TaxID=2528015 RepID=UPI001C953B5D|nr:hypothetical protein [Rubripirellula tenax]